MHFFLKMQKVSFLLLTQRFLPLSLTFRLNFCKSNHVQCHLSGPMMMHVHPQLRSVEKILSHCMAVKLGHSQLSLTPTIQLVVAHHLQISLYRGFCHRNQNHSISKELQNVNQLCVIKTVFRHYHKYRKFTRKHLLPNFSDHLKIVKISLQKVKILKQQTFVDLWCFQCARRHSVSFWPAINAKCRNCLFASSFCSSLSYPTQTCVKRRENSDI